MRASKLIDDAAAQRVDPDLVLDYICEPLPVPDQIMWRARPKPRAPGGHFLNDMVTAR